LRGSAAGRSPPEESTSEAKRPLSKPRASSPSLTSTTTATSSTFAASLFPAPAHLHSDPQPPWDGPAHRRAPQTRPERPGIGHGLPLPSRHRLQVQPNHASHIRIYNQRELQDPQDRQPAIRGGSPAQDLGDATPIDPAYLALNTPLHGVRSVAWTTVVTRSNMPQRLAKQPIWSSGLARLGPTTPSRPPVRGLPCASGREVGRCQASGTPSR